MSNSVKIAFDASNDKEIDFKRDFNLIMVRR